MFTEGDDWAVYFDGRFLGVCEFWDDPLISSTFTLTHSEIMQEAVEMPANNMVLVIARR
jgi:hypothetical protein